MSRELRARALVAASLAIALCALSALAACVIGPKPDDPLNGGDTTATTDAGEDTRGVADVGAVPSDSGLAIDSPVSGSADGATDAGADAGDAADAPDARSDTSSDGADDAAGADDADGAIDGGPG